MHEILNDRDREARTTTACLLAAGTGSRLRPLTDSIPKCLTEIDGIPILERLISCLRDQGFKRLVVVTGYLEKSIREFLDRRAGGLVVEYVHNPIYATTNNIYSLWLAGQAIQEPFLLVESDLIFESSLLKQLREPDKIAVSHILPWMNGTTVTMGSSSEVVSFNQASDAPPKDSEYKTVNICSLSRTSWNRILPRLAQTIADGRVNEYYEVVFAEMVADGSLSFECVLFDSDQWYEVDKIEDLLGAEQIARRIDMPAKPLISTVRKAAGRRDLFEQAGGTILNAAQR